MSERNWTDDQLPPVRPPTAGFLVQLFFIPMIIVATPVLVWLMFSWLAHLGTKPEELAADLEKMNQGSWQQALTLANMLRDPSRGELRHDEALAGRLANLLEREVAAASPNDESVQLRTYLCRALGEFEIPTGANALAAAAEPTKDLASIDVRRSAVQAVALLANRLQVVVRDDPRDRTPPAGARPGSGNKETGSDAEAPAILPPAAVTRHEPSSLVNNERLMQAVRTAAIDRSDNPEEEKSLELLRATAAYALGILGGPEARELLAKLLSDAHPDVRYNAATGLARAGDPRALPRLLEMLNPANPEVDKLESDVDNRHWKQIHILKAGLQATRQLIAANSDVGRSDLRAALEKIGQARFGGELDVELRLTQQQLEHEQ